MLRGGWTDRRGSVVVVIMVAVVLGLLGGSAVMMSQGYHRQDTAEGMRYSAKVVCRAIAEQASLMMHNGTCDLMVDEAVGRPVEILSEAKAAQDKRLRAIYDLVLQNAARTSGRSSALKLRPLVRVVASVIDDNRRLHRSALNQFNQIFEEIKTLDDPARRQEAVAFWERMKTDDKVSDLAKAVKDGTAENTAVEETGEATGGEPFDRYVRLTLGDFAAVDQEIKDGDDRSYDPPRFTPKSLPALEKVYQLFGTITGAAGTRRSSSFNGRKPSPEEFKVAWEAALSGPGGPGEDAAKKVGSCGSNPASALAHLLGDLKENQIVASGTEVAVTNDFLYSRKYGDSKTYLIQLEAVCPYELSGGRMKSEEGVKYTTYRLFQKAPWEDAVLGASRSLVKDLVSGSGHATFTADEIARIWPPAPADRDNPDSARRVLVPGSTTVYYDSTLVMLEPLKGVLPASVGSRLYPYTLCAVGDKPMRLRD